MSKRSDWINGELADLVFLNFKAIFELVWGYPEIRPTQLRRLGTLRLAPGWFPIKKPAWSLRVSTSGVVVGPSLSLSGQGWLWTRNSQSSTAKILA
jgi:hypothetical protein